jgi:hypothetical protein
MKAASRRNSGRVELSQMRCGEGASPLSFGHPPVSPPGTRDRQAQKWGRLGEGRNANIEKTESLHPGIGLRDLPG